MHPVAEEGFGRTVEAYRRSRPSYPPVAVEWLAEALRIGPGSTVVDVGAGTGKFTAQLAARGAKLIAVEPLAAMRAALAEEMPGVLVLPGTAESLPLDASSADAIVAAQAFHWFDLATALPELHRVLRPGGRLGVIWNELDTSVEWVKQFNTIIDVPRTGTPHPSEAGRADLGALFTTPEQAEFSHVHLHDRASILDRVASMSFVAVQPEPERAEIFERVAALIDSHPETAGRETFALPYLTRAYWAERRERSSHEPFVNLKDAWEAEARNWVAWARKPGHDSYWRFHRDAFLKLLPPPPRTVLDVGCGEGRLPRDLKARGYSVVGVDASPSLIRHAREADPDGDYRVADAAALPVDDASFELIVAFLSLHDVDNLGGAVGEVARVLKVGGRLVVAIVHPTSSAGSFESDAPDARFLIRDSYLEERVYSVAAERDGLRMTFTSRHRPMQAYADALSAAGLVIERIVEVPDPNEPPGSRWRRLPLFLQLVALKP